MNRFGVGSRLHLVVCALVAVVATGCAVPSSSGQGPDPYVAPPTRDVIGVAYGPLPEQLLDVHRPATGAGPFPAVVFFHSGGWVGGARAPVPDVIETLIADTGVAVVSVDYRLVVTNPDGSLGSTFPAASYDADRAVRFVRAHAADWNLDPGKVIAAGASAGGQLAALVGAAPGVFVDPALPPELASISPAVQGVIDYVGPSDLTTFPQAGGWAPGLTSALLGCTLGHVETCDPAKMVQASVAPHLTAAAPPAYLAYGQLDGLVVPATQGAPLALRWAAVRGDLDRPNLLTRGVWYEEEANADHNFSLANSNVRAMEVWVRLVVAGSLT